MSQFTNSCIRLPVRAWTSKGGVDVLPSYLGAENAPNEDAENTRNEDAEKTTESESIPTSDKVVASEVSIENVENNPNEATTQVEEETVAEEASIENVEIPGKTSVTDNTVVEEITDELCDDADYLETSEKPSVVIVHALAAFENSPNLALEQEDVNSLEKYIYSEKHLKDNISKVELFIQSKWEIAVQIHVITDRLWEGPRQYIWKHLGASNFWSRGNGTKIKLSRIHVKWLFHPLIS